MNIKGIGLFWILFLLMFKVAAQPIIIAQPTNQVANVGSVAIFRVSVSNLGPLTYQWQFNGTNLPLGGIITTVAGSDNGGGSYAGDGGVATNASLSYPNAVAVDAAGNLFIGDGNNNRIRKVDTNGIITTVAGGGANQQGDGGAATNAQLFAPSGVAVDTRGIIFIADSNASRIRKVNTNGIITTVAGKNLMPSFSGDGGAATNAGLYQPKGVAVDAVGNLYIADGNNNRIRKVDTNGIITTVAGFGASGGHGVSFSGDGGIATNATLNFPISVAVDTVGNVFFADYNNQRIRKVDTNGIITTVAGSGTATNLTGSFIGGYSGDNGSATNAELYNPTGVAVDTLGNLFIADEGNNRIRQVNSSGIITTVVGNGDAYIFGTNGGYSFGDGGTATSAVLYDPSGVAVDASGNLFIADSVHQLIRKVQVNSPTLLLNNISTNNAGKYAVIITGSGGSVTSSVAMLAVGIVPSITNQPQPFIVSNGHSASFVVAATGWPSLSYQWQFNGTNLDGATNTTLAFQNAFPANAGLYTVAITNTCGRVTSNPARLTVLPLGITTPKMFASHQFQFSFDTATGVNYEVQFSTNLTQWFPVMTLGGIGVPLTVIDPNAPSSPQRFYRVSLSPQ